MENPGNEYTFHAKCLITYYEMHDYVSYVFEDLEYTDSDYKYIMCVRFPNWNAPEVKEGDEGYLHVKYIIAGIDEWFDGKNFVKYNYTNVQFLKFIPIKNEDQSELIID